MTQHQEPSDQESNSQQVEGFTSAGEVKDALNYAEREPSAERAAERIAAWYEELGPRLGAFLTNPNVVLTLADARGFTEFSTNDLQDSDQDAFARLNHISQPQGIIFEPHVVYDDDDGSYTYVEIINLPGLEYTTSQTQLPGVPRYYASDGLEGFHRWVEETQAGVEAGRASGEYPPETESISTKSVVVASGVSRGYPDVAVRSTLEEAVPGRIGTRVPYANYYVCEQPNYSYLDKDEAVVAPHVEAWGRILESYYHSATHRRLEASEEFTEARERANQ